MDYTDHDANVVITFGTFDLLHVGHLNILENSRSFGTHLVVGVSSDALNTKKHKTSIYSQEERMRIVASLKCVDHVFLEESLEKKAEYIKRYKAKTLVMGDDWKGAFDDMPCDVVYLPRTTGISTTMTKNKIRNNIRNLDRVI